MFVIMVNGAIYEGRTFGTVEEVVTEFDNWNDGEVMKDEDGEVVSVHDIIANNNCTQDIYCDNMVEMGDDCVNVGVCKLDIK